jgi:hypothetical protein
MGVLMETVPARRATTHAVLAVAAVLLAFLVTPAGPASAASTVTVRLRTAIKNLPVAAETPTGYDRSKFRLWIDADGDCQDARAEVLIAESKAATTGSCTIHTGRWFSYYDRVTWTQASDVDIDHLVPLKEAWDSGAKTWDADTRMRYANDLRDPRTLVAVTDNVNQSKGDRDPADWMPRYGTCRYVREWTAVQIRWSLKVNRAEKTKLANVASHCTNVTLTVTRATIGKGTSSSTSNGTTSGGSTSGSLDPRFDYCYQATAADYGPYYQSKDPEYAWYTDSDHDGIVCE